RRDAHRAHDPRRGEGGTPAGPADDPNDDFYPADTVHRAARPRRDKRDGHVQTLEQISIKLVLSLRGAPCATKQSRPDGPSAARDCFAAARNDGWNWWCNLIGTLSYDTQYRRPHDGAGCFCCFATIYQPSAFRTPRKSSIADASASEKQRDYRA